MNAASTAAAADDVLPRMAASIRIQATSYTSALTPEAATTINSVMGIQRPVAARGAAGRVCPVDARLAMGHEGAPVALFCGRLSGSAVASDYDAGAKGCQGEGGFDGFDRFGGFGGFDACAASELGQQAAHGLLPTAYCP